MSSRDHTKHKYDECFAKLVLEKFFFDRYGTLVLSDKPDLRARENTIGIEVVNAVPQGTQEALSLASKIANDNDSESKNNDRIRILKKRGYNYTKYGMSHPSISYSYDPFHPIVISESPLKEILFRFEEKVRKLNGSGYSALARYDLFIYSERYIGDDFITPLITAFLDRNNNLRKYSFVYVFSLNGIHEFDLINATHVVIDTDKNKKVWGIPEAAWELANNGE